MPTGMETLETPMAQKRYSGVHKQQLYHWIGKHIDDEANNRPLDNALTDNDRSKYVACLEGALEDGLWLKKPKVPDQLGDGSLIKVRRPIVCFTEWALDKSHEHTSRYGHLGLGFPKRFVLERGGQPVTYVRDLARGDPYTAALRVLAEFFQKVKPGTFLKPNELALLRRHFEYLSQFAKRIQRPKPKVSKREALPRRPVEGRVSRPRREPDLFVRRYGETLHYLEEREWRIVYDVELRKFFRKSDYSAQDSHKPQHYLPFEPGRELFTVVLPDNRTVNMALRRKRVLKRLFPVDAPHVSVLSFQDIDTF